MARDLSIPLRVTGFKHKYSPYWNKECSEAKLAKKKAEKVLRKYKTLENQAIFKKAKAFFRKTVARFKQIYWEKICANFTRKTKISQVWKNVKEMKEGSKTYNRIILKNPDGTTMADDIAANNFAVAFRSVSLNIYIHPNIQEIRKKTVDTFLKTYKNSDCLDVLDKSNNLDNKTINEPFKFSELENVLRNVNKNSSPGYDNISYLYLINLPVNAKYYLLKMINYSWVNNIIPDKWKVSIIKPILKPNKNKNAFTSYRPISLTSTISKTIEKMIVNRLTWYLEKKNLIRPNQ